MEIRQRRQKQFKCQLRRRSRQSPSTLMAAASGGRDLATGRWRPGDDNLKMSQHLRHIAETGCSPRVAREIEHLADRIWSCGRPFTKVLGDRKRMFPQHSDRHLLCKRCAKRRALHSARDGAARVVILKEDHPSIRFAAFTLMLPESDDLEEQLALASRSRKALLRTRRDGCRLVLGLLWNFEVHRGLGGKWRSHLHAIGALPSVDFGTLVCVAQKWCKSSARSRQKSLRRQLLEASHAQPLWSEVDPAPEDWGARVPALWLDAYRYLLYAAKPPVLSLDDRVRAFAHVNGRPLSGCSGMFRGMPPGALDAKVSECAGSFPIRARTNNITTPNRATREIRKGRERLRWLQRVRLLDTARKGVSQPQIGGNGACAPSSRRPHRR